MWCPRCDQGEVVRGRTIQTNESVLLCEECDATWLEGETVSASSFLDFSSFMEDRHLPGVWSEIVASGRECCEDDYLKIAFNNNWLIEWTDGRLELLRPTNIEHQLIVGRLFHLFNLFVQTAHLGVVLFAPLPVKVASTRYREPDLIFQSAANHAKSNRKYYEGADLVVEVVSDDPQSHVRDYEQKLEDYARANIPEYWIVDPQTSTISVMTLNSGRYEARGVYKTGDIASSKLLEGLTVTVDDVFAAGKK